MKKILIIQGHPDSSENHLCHSLAEDYAKAAKSAGHQVTHVDVAELDFPILRSQKEWKGPLPTGLEAAQKALLSADHLVLFYPLWLGTMPALLKAFLEQILRVDDLMANGLDSVKILKGKSARIVVTMGMPAFVYRLYFGAHSLKSLKRNILGFVGVRPIRTTFIGMVDNMKARRYEKLSEQMRQLGNMGR